MSDYAGVRRSTSGSSSMLVRIMQQPWLSEHFQHAYIPTAVTRPRVESQHTGLQPLASSHSHAILCSTTAVASVQKLQTSPTWVEKVEATATATKTYQS
jgi:hypothetical protein